MHLPTFYIYIYLYKLLRRRIIDVGIYMYITKNVLIKTCLKTILDPVKYYLLQNG